MHAALMQTTLLDWLQDYAPIGTFVLMFLAVGRWVIVRLSKAEKEGEWKGTVKTQMTNFAKLTESVQRELRELRNLLIQSMISSPAVLPWIAKSSPMHLTEAGEELARDLGAHRWAKEQADQLIGDTPLEDFEIEELAFDHANDTKLLPAMRETSYDQGVPIAVTRQVLGIVLRDELLKRLREVS